MTQNRAKEDRVPDSQCVSKKRYEITTEGETHHPGRISLREERGRERLSKQLGKGKKSSAVRMDRADPYRWPIYWGPGPGKKPR